MPTLQQNRNITLPVSRQAAKSHTKPRDTPNTLLDKIKRQRNMQQMKEHGKNPQDQTNEEETGSLPEKEFRVMIVKMAPNLENKMEAQINRMKAWIKKI